MSKTCPEIGHYDATKCDGLKQDIELCKPIGFGKAKLKLQQSSFYKIPDYGVNNGILYANCITLKGSNALVIMFFSIPCWLIVNQYQLC